jgi:Na+-driven multidrug efflux pump
LRFDNEARRIFRLAIPFTISELVETVSEIVVLGIISHQLGTDALSAFAVFETLLEITTEFSGGVVDAMTTLASQAYGAGNNMLVGQYVQLCSITYFLFQIPFILMWSFATFDIMLYMGFNENIAQMAKVYARWAVWRETLLGVTEVYYNMLEVVEKEVEVAVIGNTEALFELGAIAIALYLFNGDLVTVAVIGIVNGMCFYIFTLAFTFWRGWLRPFAKGIFASPALKNRIAVKQVVKTASPLAFGSILIHGEWEVLTVFAAYLGPAEVTAWAVLGNLWDIFESSNE